MTPHSIEIVGASDTSGVTLPNPLELPIRSNEINSRRQKQDKARWGPAAHSLSSFFKSSKSLTNKPKAKRWDHLLNEESSSRQGSSLKKAAGKYLGLPGIISLGGGLPTTEYFPFEELSIKVPQVPQFTEAETRESGVTLTAGKHDLATDKSIFDISTAFQYGQGSGAGQLLRWVTEHTEFVHAPPYEDWACNMTIGNTSALDMALRMFCQRGDFMISEEYTFASAVETAAPMGVRTVGVKMDSEGMLPASLDELMAKWDPAAHDGARKPRLVYTVPSGQNPTGATQGEERRRQIYRVCQKHDLYILEDEPYYFLQMQPYTGQTEPLAAPPSHEEFLKNLVPSYLHLDVDGRVMRMDSFSKVIAPGTRVGWITASEQIAEQYKRHTDVSTQGPSGISQLVLFKLLDEHWGHAGYIDWLIHIRLSYTERRNVILAACERHLPREVVSWVPPMAGMFHWLKIDWRQHPDAGKKSIQEIEEEIFLKCIEGGALLMRGSWFYADREAKHDTMFFRATYAAAPFDRIEEAIRRFGVAVRQSFGLTEGAEDPAAGVAQTNGH